MKAYASKIGQILLVIFGLALIFIGGNSIGYAYRDPIYISDPKGAIDGRSIRVNGKSLGLFAGSQLYVVDADVATVTFDMLGVTVPFEGAERGDLIQFLPIPNGDGSSNMGYYVCTIEDITDLESCVVKESEIQYFRVGGANL